MSGNPASTDERLLLAEAVNIAPTVNVHFTVDKFSDRAHAVTSMLQGVLSVLRQTPGDAVLLFNGETVLLLRRAGQLHLDGRTGIWNAYRLKRVDMPWTLEDLPVL